MRLHSFPTRRSSDLRAGDLHHTSDYTPYEGLNVAGAIRSVFVHHVRHARSRSTSKFAVRTDTPAASRFARYSMSIIGRSVSMVFAGIAATTMVCARS